MPLRKYLEDYSAQASRSRVDTIREGLETGRDRLTWIRAALGRIEELDTQAAFFGLEQFEQEELEALLALVIDHGASPRVKESLRGLSAVNAAAAATAR